MTGLIFSKVLRAGWKSPPAVMRPLNRAA